MKAIFLKLLFCGIMLLTMMGTQAVAQESNKSNGQEVTAAANRTVSCLLGEERLDMNRSDEELVNLLSSALNQMREKENGDMLTFGEKQWMLIKNNGNPLCLVSCGGSKWQRLEYKDVQYALNGLQGIPDQGDELEEEIYIFSEEEPQFGSSKEEVENYVKYNIRWPKTDTDVEGKVWVVFVIEKDGTITNIRLLRGLHCEFDMEALRVVASMPKWKPGTQRGKVVRCQCIIPIKFQRL